MNQERKENMYKQVSTNLNFVEREKEVEKFWKDNDIFQKSIDSRKNGPTILFMMDRLPQTVSPISVMY